MTLGSTNTPIEGSEIDVPSIVESATEHISLDGSGNVEIPNGDLSIPEGGSLIDEFGDTRINFSSTSTRIFSHDGLGSGDVTLRDTANSQNILVANEGGNVEIPNGDLTVQSDTTITVDQAIGFTNYRFNDRLGSGADPKWAIDANNKVFLQDGTNSQVIGLNEGGSVEIPNGALNLGGDISSDRGRLLMKTQGTGTDSVGFFDTANGQTLLQANEGGNVDIPNGSLTVENLTTVKASGIRTTRGDEMFFDTANVGVGYTFRDSSANDIFNIYEDGNVDIPNGFVTTPNYYEVNQTNRLTQLKGNDGLVLRNKDWDAGDEMRLRIGGSSSATAGAQFRWFDDSAGTTTQIMDVSANGNVEIPNGDLNLQNNILQSVGGIIGSDSELALVTNGSGTDRVKVFDSANSQDIVRWNEGGNVEIPNGDFIPYQKILEDGVSSVFGSSGLTVEGTNGSIGFGAGSNLDINAVGTSNVVLRTGGTAGSFVGTTGLSIDGSQNVDIPNGDLNVALDINATHNSPNLVTNGSDGNGKWQIYDSFNGQPVLSANEGGPVEVQNASLAVDNIRTESSSRVSLNISSAGEEVQVFDNVNSLELFAVREGGPVEVLNADLELNDNNIQGFKTLQFDSGGDVSDWRIDGGAGSAFQILRDGGPKFQISTSDNVEIFNGGLTISGGGLTVSGDTDFSGGNLMSLPQVTADPTASAGDMWYRTDLD